MSLAVAPLRDRIYIVNSNYNHYGQSVLTQHSSTHSTLSRAGSGHSAVSLSGDHKRQRLESGNDRHPLSHASDVAVGEVEDVEEGEGEDQVVELTKTQRPKYFSYRSLINPDSKVKRFLTKLDSDGFSLFSSSSRAQAPLATVNQLPIEVLKLVVAYCDDHRTQVSCLYVNHNFYYAAKPVVYHMPLLTSSYRVAQLISSLKEFDNGPLIKTLDLSNLQPGVILATDTDSIMSFEEGIGPAPILEYALASWRDWKYRDDPLYGSMMLNSYTLSKSKSNISTCDSTVSIGSSLSRILSKWKFIHSDALEIANMKESMKKRIYKWRRKFSKVKAKTSLSRKPSAIGVKAGTTTGTTTNIGKSVNFSTPRDPRNQPFASAHPYTNKFLLKYAGLKDLPIGYILYFLDLCPNLKNLNLSQLTVSSDFAVVDGSNLNTAESTPKMPSLIDTVLGIIEPDDGHELVSGHFHAHYLSDANVYFKVKSYHQSQFLKLYELDILNHLNELQHLEKVDLSHLTWLNYRNIREFVQTSESIANGSLKMMDLTNSGMVRDLKWAKTFNVEELKEYFANEVEKVVVVEDEADILARTIGMDY